MTEMSSKERGNSSGGTVVWLTGLSGAGKTTLANIVAGEFRRRQLSVEVLDGGVIRRNLSKGLGFSRQDRDTNIRRIGFFSNLLSRNGVNVVVAAISPYRAIRDEVRAAQECGVFVEVHVDCPLEVLIKRDATGLYQKALSGEIPNMTGVSDPYEPPEQPEVVVRTYNESPDESARRIVNWLEKRGRLT